MLKYYRGDVMNILICDDNTAFAMQLEKDISEYFHNPNMNINVVTDHFDQIEGTYDVIFMDIELNDKNGIEIAKYHKDKHNCLVIFLLHLKTVSVHYRFLSKISIQLFLLVMISLCIHLKKII